MEEQADGDADHREREALGVEQRDEHEAPHADADRAEEVDRLAADPVRQRAPHRDGDEVDGRGDQDGVEGEGLAQVELGRDVGRDDDGEDVVADVLGHPGAHRGEDLAGVGAQHEQDRHLVDDAGGGAGIGALGGLAEERGLLDLQAHPQPDDDQHGGQQERDPPAPGEERLVALEGGEEGQQAVGDQLAGRGACLRPRRPEAAVLRVAVLRDDEDRAAPLATEREALDAAQHRQQHRRQHADRGVGGQQPDRERRDAHHQQRDDQQLLAAQLVAEVPEDQAAERPGDEADPVRRERQERRLQRVGRVGEEHVREDGRGRDAVQEEVVPLDGGADEARADDAGDG